MSTPPVMASSVCSKQLPVTSDVFKIYAYFTLIHRRVPPVICGFTPGPQCHAVSLDVSLRPNFTQNSKGSFQSMR